MLLPIGLTVTPTANWVNPIRAEAVPRRGLCGRVLWRRCSAAARRPLPIDHRLRSQSIRYQTICYARPVRPERTPIGLHLARTARLVNRAFDEALATAGGSPPVWLVLLNLTIRRGANQRELAEAIGVSEPTLTHHLGGMEADGLLARRRDPANRRNHIIELTELGEQAFDRLRDAAIAFDERLRGGFDPEELITLGAQLDQLASNVATRGEGPAWVGLIEAASGSQRTRRRRSPGPKSTPIEAER